MRTVAILIAAAAAATPAVALAAPSVEIKDAAARVIIVPENRQSVRVDVIKANRALPLKITVHGDKTTIDGDLGSRIKDCRGEGEAARVQVAQLGDVAWRDLPQIVVRVPRNVELSAGGGIYGVIGRSASIDLANAGCGAWTIADVAGKLKISQAGSGDARVGKVGEAHLRVAGSGSIRTGAIRNGLKVEIAGHGDVAAASISGPMDVGIAGSGDVRAPAGQVTEMTVKIAGSGNIVFGGVAERLKARIAGSGDIRVKRVHGDISRAVMGSGKVIIG